MLNWLLSLLISLALGSALHLVAIPVGLFATFVVVGKLPVTAVWIIGGYCIPFLLCGAILGTTGGFTCPRLLSPACAFAALIVLHTAFAPHIELSEPRDFDFYLPFLGVPMSFCGSLISHGRQPKKTDHPAERESQPELPRS